MRNRTSLIILVLVIVMGFATAVVASTLTGDTAGVSHTMPDGTTMPEQDMPR